MQNPNLDLARSILNRYIRSGLLSPETVIRDGYYSQRPEIIEIYYIKAAKERNGAASAFLAELKAANIKYDINWPQKEARGFWNKMYRRGLLPNPVTSYIPFEKKFLGFA